MRFACETAQLELIQDNVQLIGEYNAASGSSSQYFKLALRNVIARVLLTAESYLVGETARQQSHPHNRTRASALELTQRWLHPKQQLAHKCTLSGYKLRAELGDLR